MRHCLFVNQLTVLDFTSLDPARGLVGQSWIMDIELCGELNDEGMVFDFGEVKRILRDRAEALLDHQLVVPALAESVSLRDGSGSAAIESASEPPTPRVRQYKGSLDVTLEFAAGQISMEAPVEAVRVLDLAEITIAAVEPLLVDWLARSVPSNVQLIHVHLREESIQGAAYHYSHGLRKHAGNCQRIAHGHRSRLEIHADGQRSQLTEYQWAKRWRDIYLLTRSDLLDSADIGGHAHIVTGYEATQGAFRLTLPASRVYVMDCDTTVECIAEHILQQLSKHSPRHHFRVRAFEGVNKGAIAESSSLGDDVGRPIRR